MKSMKSILASWLCVRLVKDIEREPGRWWETDLKANSQKMLLPHFPSGSSGNVTRQFYILYKIQGTYFFKRKYPLFFVQGLLFHRCIPCSLLILPSEHHTAQLHLHRLLQLFGSLESAGALWREGHFPRFCSLLRETKES